MTRLNPFSVPYRAGATVLRFAWVLVLLSVSSTQVEGLNPRLIAAGLAGIALLALLYQLAYFRRFEYALTSDSVDIRSGVLSRRNREIPLSRIQNVDISRNLVQRALGIAEVRIETAGGSETEAQLRYVTAAEADRLQEELSRLTAGPNTDASPGSGAPAGSGGAAATSGPQGDPLFTITGRELALLGAVSVDLRLIPLVSVALPVIAPRLADRLAVPPTGGPFANPLVLAPVSVIALYLLLAVLSGGAAVANYYGFRLWRLGDELRYERGLLQRYAGTIPLDKVQRLSIRANVLARAIGYASVAVETAGYAPGESDGSQAAVPFARRERAFELARSVADFGDLETMDFERPPKRARRRYLVRYGLVVAVVVGVAYAVDRFTALSFLWQATAALFVLVPIGAQLTWRSRGYVLTDGYVLTQSGWLVRRVSVVPDFRIQTVHTEQTILQRRRSLATLVVDTAGTAGLIGREAKAIDIDADRADTLRERVDRRLQAALVDQRRERRRRRLRSLGVADVSPDDGDGDVSTGPTGPDPDADPDPGPGSG